MLFIFYWEFKRAKILLVGNKKDDIQRQKVSEQMVYGLLNDHPNIIAYAETSAKNAINVDEAFESLAEAFMSNSTHRAIVSRPIVNNALLPEEQVTSSLLFQILTHPAAKVIGAVLLVAGLVGMIVGTCGLAGVAIGISASVAKIMVGVGAGVTVASGVVFFASSKSAKVDSVETPLAAGQGMQV